MDNPLLLLLAKPIVLSLILPPFAGVGVLIQQKLSKSTQKKRLPLSNLFDLIFQKKISISQSGLPLHSN